MILQMNGKVYIKLRNFTTNVVVLYILYVKHSIFVVSKLLDFEMMNSELELECGCLSPRLIQGRNLEIEAKVAMHYL